MRRLLIALAALALIAGCAADDRAPTVARTATGTVPTTANDLADNSAHRTLKIAGESFTLTADYFLTSYDATKWRTLAGKDVHVSVHLRPTGGRTPQVLVGAVAARVEIAALDPGLDGLPVVTLTDRPPAAVPGFLVSDAYPYDMVLPAGGYTAALTDRWRQLAGDQALTEEALTADGVYANRLVFTYDLLIRNGTDPGLHKRSVTDTLTVPTTRA